MVLKASRKISILFCTEYLAYGGSEKQLMTLIKRLDPGIFITHLCCIKKTSVDDIFTRDASSLFKAIKCRKIQLDFKSFRYLPSVIAILQLSRYITRNRIDVVISYFLDPTIIAFFGTKLSLCSPLLVPSFRDLGLLRGSQHNILMKWIYRHTPYFLANSLAVKEDYHKYDGIPNSRIAVIHNGVDIYHPEKIQKTHTRPSVVGIIANMNRHVKRMDIFLRAASYVCERRSNISFVILGEGHLKDEMMSLAASLGIDDKVNFLGRVRNIQPYLTRIHIGVNTSETEGLSNVILEYLASGIPVIATDTGGNKEIIENGKNGLLFPVNDYEALGNRLLSLLDDQTLYSELCKKARPSVERRFETSVMTREYEKFLRHIVRVGTAKYSGAEGTNKGL